MYTKTNYRKEEISEVLSLLLAGEDKDYIGLKLAEKISFLLYKDKENRIIMYKLVKQWYTKRSKLVHSGESSINREDYNYVLNCYKHILFRMMELSKKFEKMGPKSNREEKDGLEDYLLTLKFSKE